MRFALALAAVLAFAAAPSAQSLADSDAAPVAQETVAVQEAPVPAVLAPVASELTPAVDLSEHVIESPFADADDLEFRDQESSPSDVGYWSSIALTGASLLVVGYLFM